MKHRDQILQLRAEGKTYNEIKEITGASKGTISYHCGKGQKDKTNNRTNKRRLIQHPYSRKGEYFTTTRNYNNNKKEQTYSNKLLLKSKINRFHYNKTTKEYDKISFKVEDLINKLGEYPKCYLTGREIDINKPRTYHFDHIIPVSRGGTNTLDNLGICTRDANMAKTDMTLDEFYKLCEDVIKNKPSP